MAEGTGSRRLRRGGRSVCRAGSPSRRPAASFAADPFEGLPVLYCSALDAYADASEDDVYAIVGDLGIGAQANFPNGEEIKFTYDEYSLSEADLVKIVGREYVALGIVAPFAFCRITKPGA